MSISVNLDQKLVEKARSASKVMSRSTTKQIEHWAKIGAIAEENPDLTYDQIKGILLGLQDVEDGNVKEFKRGHFMIVRYTRIFEKAVKKILHKKEVPLLEDVIELIIKNPRIGAQKKGDLAGIFVHKFKIKAQEYLLAYQFNVKDIEFIESEHP